MKLLVYGLVRPTGKEESFLPRSARTIGHTLFDVFYEEIKKVKVPNTHLYEFLLFF